jgi:hypothetical protein
VQALPAAENDSGRAKYEIEDFCGDILRRSGISGTSELGCEDECV